MEDFLSALAFAGLIAAQFLLVVLVSTQRCDDLFPGTRNRKRASPRAGAKAFLQPSNVSTDLLDCSGSTQPLSRPAHRV
jgi:hypothetical protein